jgi:Leucine-rich repeat (LRR) protein
MKNALIVILTVAVVILGYFLFTTNYLSNNTQNSSNQTSSNSTAKTINLSNTGLKQVPKDILDNSSVVAFNVADNNLTGALPAEIRKLTNLEVLIASDNKMTGIPAEIGQLSKLKTANFANNNISGLPLEIGNLKNLDTLDLRGNPNVSKYDISQIQSKIPNAKILTD